MDLPTFEALLTPAGQAALAAATALSPTEEMFLPLLGGLQKNYPADLAKAALETAVLRRRARVKFSRAEAMYFTREALEQASGERISGYRAQRYSGLALAADLGCGIGGDSLGLAQACRVTAVDVDPLRLRMAAENLEAYGLSERAAFVEADLALFTLPPETGAFFFDPARRAGGRRKFSVRDYSPPLEAVRAWLQQAPGGGVKISPGVDLRELAGYDCEIEFISERGELKECALWFGALRTSTARRATVLGPESVHSLLPDPAVEPPAPGPPLRYLYEPNPAVLRAGLVTTLAAQLGARQLDADIAYLAADDLRPTPFAHGYEIDEAMPFQLKRLRERLRALGVGRVTVKKRGSPLEPEELIRQLKLSGSEERVVILTHVLGKAYALIGREAGLARP